MKNKVNLLPSEYIKKVQEHQNLTKAFNLIGMIFVVLAVVFVVSGGTAALRRAKIESLEHKKAQLQTQIDEYSKYEQMDAKIKDIQSKIDSVSADDDKIVDLISQAAEKLPSGVWMESAHIENGELQFVCGANDYDDVALTITALSDVQRLSNVYCQNSTSNNGAVKFTLAAAVI